jgi:FixJ family two-component response regulator
MDIKIVMKEELEKNSLWISELELLIIKEIVQGKTSREIGADCGKSAKTVEVHRHNVLKRLRCKNMPQLVDLLHKQKILS